MWLVALPAVLFSARGVASTGEAAGAGVQARGSVADQPPVVITNIADVLDLARDLPERIIDVRLRGHVIHIANNLFALIDHAGGVFFSHPQGGVVRRHERGELLEVVGSINLRGGNVWIYDPKVTTLKKSRLPAPRQVSLEQVMTGGFISQWVQVQGVVRKKEPPEAIDGGGVWVRLYSGGKRIWAEMAVWTADTLAVGDEVKLTGLCFSKCNEAGHMIHSYMFVLAPEDIEPVRAMPNPFSLPVDTLSRKGLSQLGSNSMYGVRITGVVTHSYPGKGFWLRDGQTGVYVRDAVRMSVGPGDQVDVFGFVNVTGYSASLEDAVFRKTGRTAAPVPVRISTRAQGLEHDADLVEVEGVVSEEQSDMGERRWTVDNGSNRFTIVLSGSGTNMAARAWVSGSRVRAVGICMLDQVDDSGHSVKPLPVPFKILMRSAADLDVLRPPPWWTPRHVVMLMGVIAGIMILVVIGTVLVMRRRLLREKESRKKAEAEFMAIRKERARIARDLHDDLGSGLTEIGVTGELALDASVSAETSRDYVREIVGKSRDMAESLDEIVWAVSPRNDTAVALVEYCARHVELIMQRAGIRLRLSVADNIPATEMDAGVRHHLFLAYREAVTNIIRHSGADEVHLSVAMRAGFLVITIRDNGRGMGSTGRAGNGNGNGLLNMRQRLEDAAGICTIDSKPGGGTTVQFELRLKT